MMWICPICKTTNDTYICTSCGFDASRDYINSRSLCPLSESASKIFHPELSGDNILMASNDINYVFGRKMDRKQITAIYFRRKKISEKMPGTYRKNRMAVLWPGQRKKRMACWIYILRQMEISQRTEIAAFCFLIIQR